MSTVAAVEALLACGMLPAVATLKLRLALEAPPPARLALALGALGALGCAGSALGAWDTGHVPVT